MCISDIGWPQDPLVTPSVELPAPAPRKPKPVSHLYTRRAEIVEERPGVYGVTLERATFRVLLAWPTQWVGGRIALRRARERTGLSNQQLAGRVRRLRELGLLEFME